MKKLLIVALSVLLCASLVLSGCGKEETTAPDTSAKPQGENKNEGNALADDGFTSPFDAETATPVDEGKNLSYDEFVEAVGTINEKNDLDKEILVHVNGMPIHASAVKYAVFAFASLPEEERAKEIENYLLYNAGIFNTAEKYNAYISEMDISSSKNTHDQYKAMYGDYYNQLTEQYITPYHFAYTDLISYLFNDIFMALSADPESDFVKDVEKKTIEAGVQNDDYVRVKHILVQFPKDENGKTLEGAQASTLEKANAIYEEALALESPDGFDALIQAYNEDPGMTSNTGGYYFTYGKMVKPFEEKSFELEDFEISEPVETDYGYHIIQKLPKDYAGVENTSLFESDLFYIEASNAVRAIIDENTKDYTVEYADNYNERGAQFVEEYNAYMSEAEATN